MTPEEADDMTVALFQADIRATHLTAKALMNELAEAFPAPVWRDAELELERDRWKQERDEQAKRTAEAREWQQFHDALYPGWATKAKP